jgi:hypothetical protein
LISSCPQGHIRQESDKKLEEPKAYLKFDFLFGCEAELRGFFGRERDQGKVDQIRLDGGHLKMSYAGRLVIGGNRDIFKP